MRTAPSPTLWPPTVLSSGLALGLLAGLAGCAGPEAPASSTPSGAALELFRLSRFEDLPEERTGELFDLPADERSRASLYDAIERLASVSETRVLRVEAIDPPGETVVDLEAALPGGGSARYSVQLTAREDDRWRIRWFRGPGVEWPPPARRKDDGLTTSSPAGRTAG